MKHRKGIEHRNLRCQRVFPYDFVASSTSVRAVGAALVATVLLVHGPASAQDSCLDPFTPADAVSLGLAGAGRASPANLDNIWYGSSVLALDSRYDIHGSGLITPDSWRGFAVAALDSRTSNLAVGLSYTMMQHPDMPMRSTELPGWQLEGQSLDNEASAHHVGAGLGFSADGERRLALGLHGGYFWRKAARAGEGRGFQLGGSVSGRPVETLYLSLGTTWPLMVEGARGYEDQPRFDLGGHWDIVEGVSLLADATLPMDELVGVDFAVGAQYVIQELVPLRLGWSRNAGDVRHSLGAGTGISSEYLDLQYGIWIDLGPQPDGLAPPSHGLTLAMAM
jgi:hypothetical protein